MRNKKAYTTLILSMLAVAGFGWLGSRIAQVAEAPRAPVAHEPNAAVSSVAASLHGAAEPASEGAAAAPSDEPAENPPEPVNQGSAGTPDVALAPFHQRWSQESKSSAWGPEYESELHDFFAELEIGGAELVSADCRETLCRIEVSCDSHDILRQVIAASAGREKLRTRVGIPWVRDGHLVSFVTPLIAGPAADDHG